MERSRRRFIKRVGLAGAFSALISESIASEKAAEEIIHVKTPLPAGKLLRIGLIGAGGMGTADTNTALSHENISIVAACDLYTGRLAEAKKKWGSHLFVTQDYRKILQRDDVDVVINATTDHWHTQISVDAFKAGKHVYCEKPMVHSLEEGKRFIQAWKESDKVCVIGSQTLSSLGNEKARELYAEGAIGQLNFAEVYSARITPFEAWQFHVPEDASIHNVDWATFISNTTKRPFDRLRFFRWRNYRDYGTGVSGDLFVHLLSSLHFITDSLGPTSITATGGLRYWQDGREVPDVLLGMFDYPSTDKHPAFNVSLVSNFVDGTTGTGYLRMVGSKGSMDVYPNKVVLNRYSNPASDDRFSKSKGQENGAPVLHKNRKKIVGPLQTVYSAQEGYKGSHYDHFANFFYAIRTNGKVVEDPVFGFRAAAPSLLCNDSYDEKKVMNWDPVNMKVA